MINATVLEEYSTKKINELPKQELRDISTVKIDKNSSVNERTVSFIEQIGNPYLFMVDGVAVKVSFSTNAPTLQKSLELFFSKK